jgi:Zn-finger nucleic acid-binding protein
MYYLAPVYRDQFEKCPRCAVELVDARSARGCRACGGLWVEEAVLTEMILTMLPPRPLSRLALAVVERTDAPIGCPRCGDAMEATAIHEVSIDRCAKHGIWFDALELQQALQRVADPGRAPPLEALDQPTQRVELVFQVLAPGRPAREVRVRKAVVTLGRVNSAHVVLDGDEVSRMHAIIEVCSAEDVAIMDLGSKAGTQVNGRRIDKHQLRDGDAIRIGNTVLQLGIETG